MPSKEVWGPPIWNFLHTLAEKIREDKYPELGGQLVNFIQRVATHLPCPDCSQHASRFFKNAPPGAFNTKQKLKESLFVMHNVVNRRKNKEVTKMSILEQYKYRNVGRAYNRFLSVYNTKGNMKLLTDTFQRQMIVRDLKHWLLRNRLAFI